jgi:hypothetical protein
MVVPPPQRHDPGMRRIALSVLGGLFASVLAASPSAAAITYTWSLGKPTQIVAYQVGNGVITLATAVVLCQPAKLVLDTTKPFVYDFKVGTAKGVYCAWPALSPPPYTAPIAAYYQVGSPSSVTVHTKAGVVTVHVQPAPPTNPAIGHLPFH